MYNYIRYLVFQSYFSDINECALNGGLGPCQQICTNTVGSHYCSCLPGYTLSADDASCNGEHMSNNDTVIV